MSSNESTGAAAEAGQIATPAPAAEFPTFGSTRGSGLARGKRPAAAAASASAAPATEYKPTAIEVVNAPREYTNPFAPATPEPTEQPAPVAPVAVSPVAPVATVVAPEAPAPVVSPAPEPEAAPAQLNILPPAEQKTAPAQTWESDGFTAPAESTRERSYRSTEETEEVDISSIPAQFLYVRPGVKFVPTPRNWGGAPRERTPRHAGSEPARSAETSSAPAAAPAPAKSGGFLGWLKGLFGGQPAAEAAPAAHAGEPRREGGHRRHRGGRGPGGPEGADRGGHRRRRGGRGRGRPGGESGGPTTT